jgi:hypothetical protein
LLESDSKAVGKVVERGRSIRMAKGTERECSSITPNGIIEVRQHPLSLESD